MISVANFAKALVFPSYEEAWLKFWKLWNGPFSKNHICVRRLEFLSNGKSCWSFRLSEKRVELLIMFPSSFFSVSTWRINKLSLFNISPLKLFIFSMKNDLKCIKHWPNSLERLMYSSRIILFHLKVVLQLQKPLTLQFQYYSQQISYSIHKAYKFPVISTILNYSWNIPINNLLHFPVNRSKTLCKPNSLYLLG